MLLFFCQAHWQHTPHGVVLWPENLDQQSLRTQAFSKNSPIIPFRTGCYRSSLKGPSNLIAWGCDHFPFPPQTAPCSDKTSLAVNTQWEMLDQIRFLWSPAMGHRWAMFRLLTACWGFTASAGVPLPVLLNMHSKKMWEFCLNRVAVWPSLK